MPSLYQLQEFTRRCKRQKVVRVQIKCLLEMKQHLLPLTMPSSLDMIVRSDGSGALAEAVSSSKVIYIPMEDVYQVEGACLTGPMQIQWMGQLAKMPRSFALHTDSKFKLHHGEWVLTTIGTHYLRWDAHHHTLSTSFVPLVYLLCKQHESVGACTMLMKALDSTTLKYYGVKLEPGAVLADHCEGIRQGYLAVWPDSFFGQCWPHITRKWREGEYASKTWAHFEEVAPQLESIHLAHTAPMRDLLMAQYGLLWDKWGSQMNKFWNSHCVTPWDVWSIGLFDAMLTTPSQQPQESWHKQLATTKIPGQLRGSTEMFFARTLPELIRSDARDIPSVLQFGVPAVPKAMVKKALWYVDHRDTHVKVVDPGDGEEPFYYILRKDNKTGLKQITKRLLEMYVRAEHGEKDARIKDLEHLADVCASVHVVRVQDPKWPVPKCDLNPLELDCVSCKGFKGHGICSHVLCLNHMLRSVNLRRELLEMGKSRMHKSGGGNRKAPIPALTRAPQVADDSSDEELLRLLDEGEQGR